MSHHSEWLGTSALFTFMKWLNSSFFLCISSSLCNATDIFQIYSTLQVVFIGCLFLLIFFIHFSSFIQECMQDAAQLHKRIKLWSGSIFFPNENYWMLNSWENKKWQKYKSQFSDMFDCCIKPCLGQITVSFWLQKSINIHVVAIVKTIWHFRL